MLWWFKRLCVSPTGLHVSHCLPLGMEVASSLASQAASVTVVDIIALPFQTVLGDKVGTALQKVVQQSFLSLEYLLPVVQIHRLVPYS